MTVGLLSNPVEVLTDGGSTGGLLVMAGGKLAAVLIHVRADETGEDEGTDGWYVEAGFGPCSILVTLPPQVFADEQAALNWVAHQIDEHLS